jgi:hypothetical protein
MAYFKADFVFTLFNTTESLKFQHFSQIISEFIILAKPGI